MYVMRGRYLFGVVFGAALLTSALLVVTMAPTAETQSTQGTSITCFGSPVTDGNFNATDTADASIIGNPQTVLDTADPDDVINGLGGDDTLIRGEGDFSGTPEGGVDKLCGGPGDEELIDGADKSDMVRGDAGDDVVDGDNFPSEFGDILRGDNGNDTLTGGQGNDNSRGGKGDDMIDVGPGTTISQGKDKIRGGAGNDTINGVDEPAAKDNIKCGGGEDTVTAGPEDKVDKKSCETIEEGPMPE